jgi:sodium/hydrogen antiporter
MTGLAVFAAVLLAYALVSRRLALSAISAPMVFVAAGIVAGPDVLDLVELDATHGTAFHIAELTLAILLFADAARIARPWCPIGGYRSGSAAGWAWRAA